MYKQVQERDRTLFPAVDRASRVRERVAEWREAGQTVALVPTLGNLHAGHLSLTRLARKVADRVVMSIFVNPTQFGEGEDFKAYPRTLDEDRQKLAEEGSVDLLFVPEEQEIYPFGTERALRFVLPPLSRDLCGASRPGHFDGVASVVCRLLNIVAPQCLVMGRKDYQQLVLLEHMVTDLRLPVRVVPGDTWREADGLAMSSRNRYLTDDERRRAPALHAALEQVRTALRQGRTDYSRLEEEAAAGLAGEGFRPDYVQVRRAADLAKPDAGNEDALIVLGAAWLGSARLIDNVLV
jgi:pantoate--beta-alanine ligase